MAVSKKFLNNFKNEHILGIIGLAILLFALYKYSENKNILTSGYNNQSALKPAALAQNKAVGGVQPKSSVKTGTYAPYNGVSQKIISNSATSANEMNKPIANPGDLLPTNAASSWGNSNPVGGDLKNINLLNPSQVVGINTQGSSLRNANLQIRSEPPNPRTNTNCPWNISTIEGDSLRKSLEIGSSA